MAAAEETPPCLSCGKPSEWTSPTGHRFCQACRDIFTDLFPPDGLQPVDLRMLLTGDFPDAEWTVEPILPAGKLVGIVSKRGEGKSLLLLEVAAAVACGVATLSQPAGDPIDVIYIDMEMGPEDLYERLISLGYTADHPHFETLIAHLHYYQLVALPPLDTEAGGVALEELVDRHTAKLVIIDTVSRVVTGDENTAEPYRDLFRHTETRLKRRRVTLARLDHLGKDKERGSRGSSAKEDPLDVVWHLTHTITGAVELTLTKGRQEWLQKIVTLHREDNNGTTSHTIPPELAEEWLINLADRIERLDLPAETSINRILELLKQDGRGAKKSSITRAQRFLRGRQSGYRTPVTTLQPLTVTTPVTTGNHAQETLINIDNGSVTTPVTGRSLVDTETPPSKGGVFGHRVTEESETEDLDFDPDELPDPFDDLGYS
jgi:hypothetical protein